MINLAELRDVAELNATLPTIAHAVRFIEVPTHIVLALLNAVEAAERLCRESALLAQGDVPQYVDLEAALAHFDFGA